MYVDTTIFMYAMGSESRFKEPCARILRAGAADRTILVTSAETLQEVLHRYRSIGRTDEIRPTFEAIAASVQRILPVAAEDVVEARQLGERIPPKGAASRRGTWFTRPLRAVRACARSLPSMLGLRRSRESCWWTL